MSDDPAEVIVTMQHVRAAGLCSRGARAWVAQRGLSWDTFLADGYPASVIAGFNDALGNRVVDVARKGTPT